MIVYKGFENFGNRCLTNQLYFKQCKFNEKSNVNKRFVYKSKFEKTLFTKILQYLKKRKLNKLILLKST